jgi:SpoVK/Ycf46/Vps4 family AAA+-type ATPase
MQILMQFLNWLARLFRLGADRETPDRRGDLARKIEPRASFEVLELEEPQKSILRDVCARARNDQGGTVVLFTGAGARGKADAAEAVAKDLQRDLYRVDSSRVVSKYIGETEKNLDRLFNAAESTSAILFFDEADALFGKRSEVKDSHDRFANIEINYLLQRLETYKGVAILALSREDPSQRALQRFHFVVDFRRPPRT